MKHRFTVLIIGIVIAAVTLLWIDSQNNRRIVLLHVDYSKGTLYFASHKPGSFSILRVIYDTTDHPHVHRGQHPFALTTSPVTSEIKASLKNKQFPFFIEYTSADQGIGVTEALTFGYSGIIITLFLCLSIALYWKCRIKSKRALNTECVHCGYSLQGTTGGACPECGGVRGDEEEKGA